MYICIYTPIHIYIYIHIHTDIYITHYYIILHYDQEPVDDVQEVLQPRRRLARPRLAGPARGRPEASSRRYNILSCVIILHVLVYYDVIVMFQERVAVRRRAFSARRAQLRFCATVLLESERAGAMRRSGSLEFSEQARSRLREQRILPLSNVQSPEARWWQAARQGPERQRQPSGGPPATSCIATRRLHDTSASLCVSPECMRAHCRRRTTDGWRARCWPPLATKAPPFKLPFAMLRAWIPAFVDSGIALRGESFRDERHSRRKGYSSYKTP